MLNCALLIFFPTFRSPPAWNPSLERRKLMILTGSKLQPTLCRKFALHWKQLNLNHTFHWKAPHTNRTTVKNKTHLWPGRATTCIDVSLGNASPYLSTWKQWVSTAYNNSFYLSPVQPAGDPVIHKNPCRSLPRYPRPVIQQNQSSQGRLGPSLLRLINSIRQLQKVKTHFSKQQQPKCDLT